MKYENKASNVDKTIVEFIYNMNIESANRQGKFYKSCIELVINTAIKERGWKREDAEPYWKNFIDETLLFMTDRERRANAAAHQSILKHIGG